jgi:hypothetical protein
LVTSVTWPVRNARGVSMPSTSTACSAYMPAAGAGAALVAPTRAAAAAETRLSLGSALGGLGFRV